MSDEVFSFTPEQRVNLEKWSSFLNTEEVSAWAKQEKEAIESIHYIIKQARFEEGNNLSTEQLDDIFRHMHKLIFNRALNRKLYEDNGLNNFNTKLRTLLYSKEPLAKRVSQFFELKRVRMLTLSHFLCCFSPTEYPEIGGQTFDILELDSTQLDVAYKQALMEHNISSPQDYRGDTLEYLRDMVVFREIKILLHIEEYNLINDILWLGRGDAEIDEKPPSIALSMEKDLRDYLADNPHLIEKGLTLVQKEYEIIGAGRADILCRDKTGNYVVIETKKLGESDKVVGQILRYIGGLKKEGRKVRGIIVINEPDEKLNYAIEAVKDFIKLKYYRVRFEITDAYN